MTGVGLMKLIVTVDTEEDHWSRYRTIENRVENIERLVPLQELFDNYDVRPTYLITYPVATNPRSVAILKSILEKGNCEIGAHCHPWNTPPFESEISEYTSMLCNLPEELQYAKLKNLHEAITQNFAVAPVSFRAGRWGFSSEVARCLLLLGFRVDSSITPFRDWAVYQGPDFSNYEPWPFRFSPNELTPRTNGELLQVPPSIGFLQSDFQFCHRLSRLISRRFHSKLHVYGLLDRLGLLNKVWLSPEHADAGTMIKLSQRMKRLGFPCLNMTFHSPSLMAGLSPFVGTVQEETLFLQRIESVLQYAVGKRWESSTLSQYEAGFNN